MNMRLNLLTSVMLASGCADVLSDPPAAEGGESDAVGTTMTEAGTAVSTSGPEDGSSETTPGGESTAAESSSGMESTEEGTSTGSVECDPAERPPSMCYRGLRPGTMIGTDNPVAFIADDLDVDGIIDLVTVDESSRSVSTFRGTGDGWFWPGNSYSVDPRGIGGMIYQPVGGVPADLDGDGHDELLVGLLQLLQSDLLVFESDGTDAYTLTASTTLPGQTFGFEGAALDVDGDLDLDVATNAGPTGMALLRNDGAGALTIETIDAAEIPTNVRALDMVGDSATDVMISHAQGLELFENQAGTLTSVALVAGPDTPGGLAVGDLDGDGLGDAVAVDVEAAQLSIRLGTGSGFAEPTILDSTFEPALFSGARSDLELGDLDDDGDLDLVVGGNNDGIAVFEADGTGGFDDGVRYEVGHALARIELADLDGDGRTDIAALNGLGLLLVLLNDPCACAP